MPLNDHELILRARGGDMSAFEQLVYRYDKHVLGIAARYCTSADDAKDIYQEVFIRVYKGLRKFESRSEFPTWLYRITTNVCLTHHARRKRHYRESPTGGPGGAGDDPGLPNGAAHEQASNDPSPEDHAMSSEITARVNDALGRLSPRQKLVFTLRHYQGYKLREIAGMMQLTEGTVKRYLFTATQKLRTELREVYEG